MKGLAVELVQVLLLRLLHLQLLFWIVDESAQFCNFFLCQLLAKEFLHLAFDVSACIAKNMQEGFILAMYVSNEMFSPFGQVHDSFEIDYLCAGTFCVGERLREQFQESHVPFNILSSRSPHSLFLLIVKQI